MSAEELELWSRYFQIDNELTKAALKGKPASTGKPSRRPGNR
jgi:hypothetical protein